MSKDQHGFTIIELLIATTVFSLILLLITLSLFDITRTYYKGITNSKTQEAARSIIQDVSQAVQFNGSVPATNNTNNYCVGARRYTYALNKQVQDTPVVHGLVADNPSGGCSEWSPNNLALLVSDSTELLGPNMRVSKFQITSVGGPGSNLYKITVRVLYGDNDLLVDTDTPADGVYDKCDPAQRAGMQFCAVSELSTVVQQRVQ